MVRTVAPMTKVTPRGAPRYSGRPPAIGPCGEDQHRDRHYERDHAQGGLHGRLQAGPGRHKWTDPDDGIGGAWKQECIDEKDRGSDRHRGDQEREQPAAEPCDGVRRRQGQRLPAVRSSRER